MKREIPLTNRINQREHCCSECGAMFFDVPDHTVSCPECKESFYIYMTNTVRWTIVEKHVQDKLKQNNKYMHYAKDHPDYEENF